MRRPNSSGALVMDSLRSKQPRQECTLGGYPHHGALHNVFAGSGRTAWPLLGIPPRMPDLQPSPKNSSVARAQDVDVQYHFQMSMCRKQCWVSSSPAPEECEMVITTYVNCAISHRAHSIAAGTAWHMHLVTLCNIYGKMHFSDTFLVILRFCGSPALQRD